MTLHQLKRLAADLRILVARFDIKLSHGQALNLIAALPGLRNWSEVKAFAERIEALEFDLAGMERLSRRLHATTAQPGVPAVAGQLKADILMRRLAPWLLDAPPRDPARRDRLIIVTSDSAQGSFRHSGIDAHVNATWSSLVLGPVPTSVALPDFFKARLETWDGDPETTDQPQAWEREMPKLDPRGDLSVHLDLVGEFERIELWIDPEPNAQLLMLQLLDWFGRQRGLLERLFIVHPHQSIGELSPFQLRAMNPRFDKVSASDIDLAMTAWKAYGEPTPQAWFGLQTKDLQAFPNLRRAVELTLGELPAAGTALGASQRRVLKLIAAGGATPRTVLAGMTRAHDPDCVFDYWEIGRLLDGLARDEHPVVLGLEEGPFDLAMHQDKGRHALYRGSSLELSDLGHALLAGADDLARHLTIRHWWGGTKLTNERLWRWDPSSRTLLPPKDGSSRAGRRPASAARDRLAAGKTAAREGRYDEALAAYEWFFNHALEESRSFAAVRLSFCLSYWAELGKVHPTAQAALISLRDEKRRTIDDGDFNENVYDDLMAINRTLRDRESTYQTFMTIYASDRTLACSRRWSREALSSIVEAGNHVVARECIGDPTQVVRDVAGDIALHRANQIRRPFLDEAQSSKYEEHMVDSHARRLQMVLDVVRHTDGLEASEKLRQTAVADLPSDELGKRVVAKLNV